MKKLILLSFLQTIAYCLAIPKTFQAQSVLLYQNSFESPLIQPIPNCGPDLDASYVNTLWGGTGTGTGGGGTFDQVNTVETILINGPDDQYTDPTAAGGDYCISMLSIAQDDRVALTLNSQMLPYANLSFLLSPIDLAGCGGPFGVDTAEIKLTVYDSPGGIFSFSTPGTILDMDTVIGGAPGPTPYTFNWSECTSSLMINNSTDGYITIEFDLLRSGYAALDEMEISSSISPSAVNENINMRNFKIGPNPFTTEFIIDGTADGGELWLYDLRGTEVLHQITTSSTTRINTNHLLPGVYLLKYTLEGKFIHLKLDKN